MKNHILIMGLALLLCATIPVKSYSQNPTVVLPSQMIGGVQSIDQAPSFASSRFKTAPFNTIDNSDITLTNDRWEPFFGLSYVLGEIRGSFTNSAGHVYMFGEILGASDGSAAVAGSIVRWTGESFEAIPGTIDGQILHADYIDDMSVLGHMALWFWIGLFGLVALNAGVSFMGDAVKNRTLFELKNADKNR